MPESEAPQGRTLHLPSGRDLHISVTKRTDPDAEPEPEQESEPAASDEGNEGE